MDVAFSFPLYISDNDKKTGDSTEVSNNLYIRGASLRRETESINASFVGFRAFWCGCRRLI